MVFHYITASDHHYLDRGLCLYESLEANKKSNFVLHYLALSDECEYRLKKANIPNIVIYTLKDLTSDPNWPLLQQHNAEVNGLSSWHFCFASFFSNWLMQNNKVPYVMYLDADLFFLNSIENTIEELLNDKNSIGFISHKNICKDDPNNKSGFWNVGAVFFNQGSADALKLWSELTVNKNNPYFATHGNCWDQKYLEVIEEKFPKRIYNLCYSIGNLAPWNIRCATLSPDLKQMVWHDWDGLVLPKNTHKLQTLAFYHFSHFSLRYSIRQPIFAIREGETFVPETYCSGYKESRNGEWDNILDWPRVKDLYDYYYRSIVRTREKYKLDQKEIIK